MYARIITSQLQPGKAQEALTLWQDKIAPLLKQEKGFRGAYVMGNRATDKSVVMVLWETEADATARDTSGAYQQLQGMFTQFLAAPPALEQLEVLLQV